MGDVLYDVLQVSQKEVEIHCMRFLSMVCIMCCKCKSSRKDQIFLIHRFGTLDVHVMGKQAAVYSSVI